MRIFQTCQNCIATNSCLVAKQEALCCELREAGACLVQNQILLRAGTPQRGKPVVLPVGWREVEEGR